VLTQKSFFNSLLVITLAQKIISCFPDLRIFIIGDGPAKEELQKTAKAADLDKIFFFLGTISEPEKLAPYMRLTDFIILPGAVGLSIVHSFIYGIPFLTLEDAPHGPEVAYLRSDHNGYLAKDIDAMAEWLKKVFDDSSARATFRNNCLATIRDEVNLINMVANFLHAFQE